MTEKIFRLHRHQSLGHRLGVMIKRKPDGHPSRSVLHLSDELMPSDDNHQADSLSMTLRNTKCMRRGPRHNMFSPSSGPLVLQEYISRCACASTLSTNPPLL